MHVKSKEVMAIKDIDLSLRLSSLTMIYSMLTILFAHAGASHSYFEYIEPTSYL